MWSTYLTSLAFFVINISENPTGRRVGRDEGREDEWEKKGGEGRGCTGTDSAKKLYKGSFYTSA